MLTQPRWGEHPASQDFAKDAFTLMHRVTDGDIDSELANRIMMHPRRHLLVDFEATRRWSATIRRRSVYEFN